MTQPVNVPENEPGNTQIAPKQDGAIATKGDAVQAWQVPVETLIADDPLVRCLVILTKLFHNPFSSQTLTAGLPLDDGRLTPELFIRAANRAGLTARVVKRELMKISPLTLPCVLLLKNGNACVATARDEANVWTIIQPESDGGETKISNAELLNYFDGVAIFWLGGPLVLVPLVIMPIIVLIALALQRPLQSVIQKSFRLGTQKHATLIETLTGIDTLKAISAEGVVQRKWENIIGEQSDLSLRSKLLTTAIVNQSGLFQQLAYIGVVIVGCFLISERMLTMGGLIASSMLTGRVTAPLAQVASLITRYFQARSAVQGVDDIMQLPIERPEGKNYIHRPTIRGDIEFRNVTFNYPEAQVPALINISFRIRSGEKVGIIGRIGSGKSTIEKLILGIYEPTEGSIWVDGVDLQQIDPADLRRSIGYVPQDVMLFFGTVKENIVLGAPYVDDSMVLRAAEIAGVTEFVNRHPQGFDMHVGERGEGLSGGQRQSVANARALLLDAPILVLDEPSNSLDNRSEENFKTRLAQHLGNHTLLLVTHRASLLTMVDRLIVMDGGQIIADGPKEQVMQALSGGKLHVAKN